MAETDARQRLKSQSSSTDGIQIPNIPRERVEVKPPIDLIPDEFPRDGNTNMLVEMVYGEDDGGAQTLKKCLEAIGYCVSETDKDRQKMGQQIDENWTKNVLSKIEERDPEYDGLIVIFAKVLYKNEDMTNLWSQFTSQTCPKLKNKPKIFIFQLLKRSAQADYTATALKWDVGYETPVQADLLIIHDMYDQGKPDLLTELSTSIEDHGSKEDVITLASLSYTYDFQPLIISTLTRKFYFEVHEHRGYYYDFHQTCEDIKKQVNQLEMKLFKETPEEKPVTTRPTLMKSLKKTFSFKKKKKSNDAKLDENGGSSKSPTSVDGKRLNNKGKIRQNERPTQEMQTSKIKEINDNHKEEDKTETNNASTKLREIDDTSKEEVKKEINNPSAVKSNFKIPPAKKPVLKTSASQKSLTISEKSITKSRSVSVSSIDLPKRPSWKP